MQLCKQRGNLAFSSFTALTDTGHNFLGNPVDYRYLHKLQFVICPLLPFLADRKLLMIPGINLHNFMPKSALMWLLHVKRRLTRCMGQDTKTDY